MADVKRLIRGHDASGFGAQYMIRIRDQTDTGEVSIHDQCEGSVNNSSESYVWLCSGLSQGAESSLVWVCD